MMNAAWNHSLAAKETFTPGWAHNSRHIAQLLIDSIGNLGGNVAAYTRP